MRLLAAPDKFKGTASAAEVAEAMCAGVTRAGGECLSLPLADGGEGTLDALGGTNRRSTVTGPAGHPVEARWRLDRGTAVIEMAEAAGLVLAGGPEANDPLEATTAGVGELLLEAVEAGATSVIVGVGGSATTDGGLGALEALGSPARLAGVDVVVACDVRTGFLDAARVFAPQKGATKSQIELLSRRLEQLADRYQREYGIDVETTPRTGAAGGLAGGLHAMGARLVDGFDVVAETVGLADALETVDVVLTGEGFLDAESFAGKVVGGVIDLADHVGVPVIAVVGQVFDEVDEGLRVISLADRVGIERAMAEPLVVIEDAVAELVKSELAGL